MPRVRISTTVDAERLERCRTMVGGPDSVLFDQAIEALIERLEALAEDEALTAHPYDSDPDLAWAGPSGPDLPYDGDVPKEVAQLARRRRQRR